MTAPVEHELPFAWGWWGMDLGRARPVPYTYDLFPYDSLPPLPALDGTLGWLGPVKALADGAAERSRDIEARSRLAQLEYEAAHLGLALPPAYVRLMGSSERRERIPEYAGSWFPPMEHIVPCIGSADGFLIRVLSDQQDVVVWFIYLTPGGDERVIGSFEGDIDAAQWEEVNDGLGPNAEERARVIADARICAPSFEAFIYRFWLESTLYRKLHGFDDTPLTVEEQRYLAHCAPALDTSDTGKHDDVTGMRDN